MDHNVNSSTSRLAHRQRLITPSWWLVPCCCGARSLERVTLLRTLAIDADKDVADTITRVLSGPGIVVSFARCTAEGLRIACQERVDLIFADLDALSSSAFDLLTGLRRNGLDTPVVVMAAVASIRSAVQAMRLGALDYFEKPIGDDDILRSVENALTVLRARMPEPSLTQCHSHVLMRWAWLILRLVESPSDPAILDTWADLANVSRSTLENRCRVVGLTAKGSLDFGRVLRAIVIGRRHGIDPAALLDADPRTLARLREKGGLPTPCLATSVSPHTYLARQRFVTNPLALNALRTALVELSFLLFTFFVNAFAGQL